LNLFVSNLCLSLRDKLLKTPPATLYGAFEAASQVERLQETPKRPTAAAMTVEGVPCSSPVSAIPADTDASADGLDKEIDAFNFRLKALKNRQKNTSTRPPTSGRPQQQQQLHSGPLSRSTPARDPNFKCCYCKKLGRGQYECNSCRAAEAPMVTADGTPYKPASQQACVHQVIESPLSYVPQQGYPQGNPQGYPLGYAAAPPGYLDFHYAE
jgi:hypothetical protein